MTIESSEPQSNSSKRDGDMIKLGKKLENPYTVENMRKAYEKLKGENQLKSGHPSDVEITTTDLYVRFLPKDSTEINILTQDTTLELFDHPLDYEILKIGAYYQDPEIPEDSPTWQYTVVKPDYAFPDIKYEILANLFLVDEEAEEESGTKSAINTSGLWYDLEDEALRMTGNYEAPETEEETDATLKRRRKKRPQGYVTVLDTERNRYVGVEGVKVRTRRWFSYGRGYTNSSGYYSVNRRYRRSVHYCVFFRNKIGFKIRAGLFSLWKAKHHVGKHNRRGYDIKISSGSRAWPFATVNNAVVKYWKLCNRFGARHPHSNLRIIARKKSNPVGAAPMLKHNWGVYGFTSKSVAANFFWKSSLIGTSFLANTFFKLVLPDLVINAHPNTGTRDVEKLCFHELAHASHFKKAGSSYWTKYINYIATYGAYGAGTGKNAGYCGVGEMWANFFAEYCYRMHHYNSTSERFSSTSWHPEESFFEPGFLMDAVSKISDLSVKEVNYCLTSSTNSIPKLRDKLKKYTIYDDEIDKIYEEYKLP